MIDSEIQVKYENGLPVFIVPLPSRNELCQFTLRPVNNTLGDFIRCLQEEDYGIDRVSAYNTGKVFSVLFTAKQVLKNLWH